MNYPRYLTLLILAICLCGIAAATDNKPAKVEGEYVYYDDGSHPIKECKLRAAELAKNKAIADKFGTTVSQSILQTDIISSGHEHNYFLALSSSDARGVWVGNISEPEYEVNLDENDNYIVTCRVKGYARPLSNEAPEFEAIALRNGSQRGNAETRFVDNDDLRLIFSSPCDGYIAVYLEDEQQNVAELLPYPEDTKSFLKVKRGREYVFFDENRPEPDCGPVRQPYLTAENGLEFNSIYVIFSPEPFSRPVTTKLLPDGPGILSAKNFHSWLTKARLNDPKMGMKTINIQISPEPY